jgi:hypothetical protein
MRKMIHRITSLIVLLIICIAWSALCGWSQNTKTGENSAPRFEDFAVPVEFKGKPAPVDLSSDPDARRFRTKLREGAKEGPNFAGHYTIVSWHCGTECQVVAVVDAKTGRVYFAPFVPEEGFDFRLNSSLFIANPPEAMEQRRKFFGTNPDPEPYLKSIYYKWENDHFVLIYPKDESKQ